MFGSDWPVCLLAASYREVVEAMQSLVGDDANVFGETATRVYGLRGR
jgi:L-fuconolactonase